MSIHTLLYGGPMVVALGFLAYMVWTRNTVLVEAEDFETGDVFFSRCLRRKKGVKWKKRGYEPAMIRPKAALMREKKGLLWKTPLIRINANSGNQLDARPTADADQAASTPDPELWDDEETLENPDRRTVYVELVEYCWPQIYLRHIDGNSVEQAYNANAPWIKDIRGVLALAVIGLTAVLILFVSRGGLA